jgi:hypothetical protein
LHGSLEARFLHSYGICSDAQEICGVVTLFVGIYNDGLVGSKVGDRDLGAGDTRTGWIGHQSDDPPAIHLCQTGGRVKQEQTGKQQNYRG